MCSCARMSKPRRVQVRAQLWACRSGCRRACAKVRVHRSVCRNVDGHGCAWDVCVCAQTCVQAWPCVQACVHKGRHRCVCRCASRDACAYPRVSQTCTHTPEAAPIPPFCPPWATPQPGREGSPRRSCACNAGTWRVRACVPVCLSALRRVCAPQPVPVCPCVCVPACARPRPRPGAANHPAAALMSQRSPAAPSRSQSDRALRAPPAAGARCSSQTSRGSEGGGAAAARGGPVEPGIPRRLPARSLPSPPRAAGAGRGEGGGGQRKE